MACRSGDTGGLTPRQQHQRRLVNPIRARKTSRTAKISYLAYLVLPFCCFPTLPRVPGEQHPCCAYPLSRSLPIGRKGRTGRTKPVFIGLLSFLPRTVFCPKFLRRTLKASAHLGHLRF